MLEFKLDGGSERIFVDQLKETINKNPILLQNILEPTINGIISDMNLPSVITTKLSDAILRHFDQNPISPEVVKECVGEVVSDKINEYAEFQEKVNQYFSSEQFHTFIQPIIAGMFRDYDTDRLVSDGVSEYIERNVNTRDLDGMVHDSISDLVDNTHLNVEEIASDSINERVDGIVTPAMVRELVVQKIDGNITKEEMIEIFRQVYIAKITSDLEPIGPHVDIPAPVVQEIEESHVYPKTAEEPRVYQQRVSPTDTLVLKVRCDVTPSFMWMLKSMINENSVQLVTVNGESQS